MADPNSQSKENEPQRHQPHPEERGFPLLDGDRFIKAIRVFVDSSIKDSLAHEPHYYADSILPALFPAMKRAIATFMSSFVATLQNLLERSLSTSSLKWRLEALRTGRPFAEIAILHSLIYRVEQVTLIDHESGLMLDHVEAPDAEVADPDLTSGMITAVTDFIRDSFKIQYSTASGTLQYGEHLIWTERGQTATLAAWVRGQPPPEFREVLQNALHQIQINLLPSDNQQGKKEYQEGQAVDYLKPCLSAAYQKNKKKSIFWRSVSIAIAAILLATPVSFTMVYIRSHLLLARYEETIKQIPGLVVIQSGIKNHRFYFYGLRDPFSKDPTLVLREAQLNTVQVILDLHPFISTDPLLLQQRLRTLFKFPKTVGFKIKNGVLFLNGSVPYPWMDSNRKKLNLLSSWIPFDVHGLTISSVKKPARKEKNASKESNPHG